MILLPTWKKNCNSNNNTTEKVNYYEAEQWPRMFQWFDSEETP